MYFALSRPYMSSHHNHVVYAKVSSYSLKRLSNIVLLVNLMMDI